MKSCSSEDMDANKSSNNSDKVSCANLVPTRKSPSSDQKRPKSSQLANHKDDSCRV